LKKAGYLWKIIFLIKQVNLIKRLKGRRNMKFWLGLLVGLWLIHPPEAFAYIDPGTGSFILQMLIAGAMGLLFAAKTYWQKITSYVRQVFSKDSEK
jgi:hypothetical protein